MKALRIAFAVLAIAMLGCPAAAAADETKTVTCKNGPVTRTFGNTSWQVFSCSDDHTILIVAAKDSPASPSTFIFYWDGNTYHLIGDEKGDKTATDAAKQELNDMSPGDVAALLDATKSAEH